MSKKILILDDDRLVTTIYAKHFRAAGFDVRIANSGEEGLVAVDTFEPDAVLLDLNMPHVNGIDWLTQVRADPRFTHLPVLVLTAGKIGWQVWAASHSGVAFVFKKNAVPRHVVAAINDSIALARLDAAAARPRRAPTQP